MPIWKSPTLAGLVRVRRGRNWEGPTINDAGASGAFRLDAGRGEVAASGNASCAFTLIRLPRDRWRIVAHEPPGGAACGGMNATVEGTYRRSRR